MNIGRFIKVAILILFAFGSTIFAQKEAAKGFEDKEYQFTVGLPENWIQIVPPPSPFRLKLVRKGQESHSDIGIGGTHAPGLAQASSADFVQQFLNDPSIPETLIRRGNPTAKLISSGKTTLANREAFFMKSSATFDTPDGKFEMTVFQILMLSEGDSYIITLRVPSRSFDDLFPEFQKMLTSFSIVPAVPKS